MIRRPPRSTRTDTLCPYTTLFRSHVDLGRQPRAHADLEDLEVGDCAFELLAQRRLPVEVARQRAAQVGDQVAEPRVGALRVAAGERLRAGQGVVEERSEERRVGEGCVSTSRSLWSPSHEKKKKTK